jgi:phenylacetate-CoA ligase
VLREGRRDLRLRVALASAESLPPEQREAIAAAFQCPVRETYGMAENVASATECPSGRLHLWPEVGLIEVVDGDRPVPAGQFGEFICTGLLNTAMPLIRYRLGDCGWLAPEDRCDCGRTLPLVGRIEGRTTDVLLTRDGRRVFWLNPVLYGLPVREAQFVQEALDRIVVRYVAGPGFSADTGRVIVERLRERMGDVQVELVEAAEIPRSRGQKVRGVICNIPAAERDAVLRRPDRLALLGD